MHQTKLHFLLSIALVEIDKKVAFSNTIHPVCLPDKENYEENPFYRHSVTIIGFGRETGDNRKTMRQHNQQIQSFNLCNARYNVSYAGTKYKRLLMREFPTGFDKTLTCALNSR